MTDDDRRAQVEHDIEAGHTRHRKSYANGWNAGVLFAGRPLPLSRPPASPWEHGLGDGWRDAEAARHVLLVIRYDGARE